MLQVHLVYSYPVPKISHTSPRSPGSFYRSIVLGARVSILGVLTALGIAASRGWQQSWEIHVCILTVKLSRICNYFSVSPSVSVLS